MQVKVDAIIWTVSFETKSIFENTPNKQVMVANAFIKDDGNYATKTARHILPDSRCRMIRNMNRKPAAQRYSN